MFLTLCALVLCVFRYLILKVFLNALSMSFAWLVPVDFAVFFSQLTRSGFKRTDTICLVCALFTPGLRPAPGLAPPLGITCSLLKNFYAYF